MEANSQLCDITLYNQIEEAYGKVVYTYTTQVIHAGRLHTKYTALKWGQLILSAVSTGGFIGVLISNQILLTWLGGICSTILLVLTAYFKDSDLSAIYKLHLDTSNKLWLLREQYLSLLTDFPTLPREDVVSRRDDLQERVAAVYASAPLTDNKSYSVADGLFCREIDGLFCRSSPDIIVRRRCVLSHKRRGWLQPSPSFRYSRNLALQDELYHPVINNGPAVLVCVDKRLGTGPVNQSRDAG